MIYQNLAIALAATSTLAAAAPKGAYYAKQTYVTSPTGGAKVHENRGFVQTTSYVAATASLIPLDNTQTTYGTFPYTHGVSGGALTEVSYIADHSVPSKVPPTLFATVTTSAYPAKNGAKVHVFHGFKRTVHKQWSESQVLSADAEFNEQSYFGASVAPDLYTNHRIAIGCPGCNVTAPDSGQVYIYSPSPNGLSWSQTQILGLTSNNYHDLGSDVKFYDDLVIAAVQAPGSKQGYAVFQQGADERSQFEYKQILTATGSVTSASLYEETIVLGYPSATYRTFTTAGEVQILYPSTEEYGLKPAGKPRPVQWSVQQVLHSTNPANADLFGTAVSINRNTLIVTEGKASSNAYVYKREEKGGMWSVQATLALGLVPTSVSSTGSSFIASSAAASILYSDNDNWNCLRVSLEDQFGDDWDTAELIVSAPDGTHDYFSPGCDHAQTTIFQYRYCPNVRSDEGVYSFSIPEAIKAKHYWEITWRIYDENKATWYIGQWDTKMDFHWDSDSLSFYPRKMDKVRTNTTCGGCPTKPTDKPTPISRRNLKGSETHHPTLSPAPTLTISANTNWRSLSLITVGTVPWFNAFYKGTNYYVSDAHGHRLLHTGTVCAGVAGTTNCWLDLPDGDYLIRLGAGAFATPANRKFRYCKMNKDVNAGSQLSLRIRDGDCLGVSVATRDAVCNSNGYAITSKFYLVLSVNMIVYGTTVSEASSAERTVFSSAVASLFPGMQSNEVELVSVASSGSGTFVTANLKMSSDIGYNLVDYDGELAFETFIQNAFTSRANELSLAAALTSGSVSSAFSHVSKVEFVDYQIVGSHEEIPASALSDLADEVTTYADTTTQSTSESTSSSSNYSDLILNSVSVSGYFLAALGVVALAVGFFVVKRQTTSNTHQPIPDESETSSKIEIGAGKRKAISTKALSATDLKELAQMEQEYLKIVSK